MNAKILEVYKALRPHVLQLHIRWAQFRFLFTVSDERMTILSNVAPGFFATVRDVLRDDAFISISRLTDDSSTRGKNNLTLVTLVELVESSDNNELAVSARLLLDQLHEQVQNMRKWRNQWLAHTDYDQAVLDRPLPEYGVQRVHVDNSIRMILDIMNLFASHLEQTPLGRELPIVVGDANVLAQLLESMQDSPKSA